MRVNPLHNVKGKTTGNHIGWKRVDPKQMNALVVQNIIEFIAKNDLGRLVQRDELVIERNDNGTYSGYYRCQVNDVIKSFDAYGNPV